MTDSYTAPFSYSPQRERVSLWLRRVLGDAMATRLILLYRGWDYRRIMDYVKIDGWLGHGEAINLYETARKLPAAPPPVVVEIGSWLGKSSVVIARGLEGKSGAILHCIDPFDASGDDASLDDYRERRGRLRRSLQDQFIENVRRRGLSSIVRPIRGFSHEVRPDFHDPLDMLFIDGNHEYESVLRDFRDWEPLLKPGGYIGFHDVSFIHPDTGPQRVVTEQILNNPRWIDCIHVQSLFMAKKAGDTVRGR